MSIDDKGSPAPYVDEPVGRNGEVDEKRGNAADRADMYRMGKAQEMRVRTLVPGRCVADLGLANSALFRETFASCPSLAFP